MNDIFDKLGLMEEIDDDREFLAESVNMLEEDAPNLLAVMQDALDRGDAESICQNAHTLKSMVGNFFAKPCFDAAYNIETQSRQGDLNGVDKALANLETEINRLTSALRQVVNDD